MKLDEEGKGRMYCLAGIGAHIAGMVESDWGAKRIVALGGCDTACARNSIEHAGLAVTDWVCVTNAGISKNHEFNIVDQEVNLITRRTMESLSRPIEAGA
ncbi:putative zinc-binding protein [Chloroflexota bacterium]